MIETIKVKPWGKDQGDHVVINAEDFDPKVHSLLAGEKAPEPADDPSPPASAEKPVPKPRAKPARRKKGAK